MSMTENEIIKMLEVEKAYMDSHGGRSQSEALAYAIESVKEIQQYRAIGTVEELKSMKENGAFTGVELAQLAAMQMRLKEYSAIGTIEELQKAMKYASLAKKHGTVGKAIDSCAEYETIGTIEEFKALKEKECKCEDCAGCTNWKCDYYNIRAKAIDEFVNLVNECSGYTPNCIEHDLSLTVYTIHQIAEEMRGAE